MNVSRVQHVVQEIFLKSPSMLVKSDETVAIGALLQCALIVEDRKKLLPHLIPLSLGLKLEGGFRRIICRVSMIPREGNCDSPHHVTQHHMMMRMWFLYGFYKVRSLFLEANICSPCKVRIETTSTSSRDVEVT